MTSRAIRYLRQRWQQRRRGIAVVEFALVTPVMFLIPVGMIDLTNGFTAQRRVSEAALAVGQIATGLAAQPNTTNSLTTAQAQSAASAIFASLPTLLGAPANTFSVTLTSVVMTPTVAGCTSACTYRANVAWSHVLYGSATTARACGQLTSAAAGTAPSASQLPADAFTAAPLLVVDVRFTFTPLFFTFVKNSISMSALTYLPPRTGTNTQWVRYVDSSPASHLCPGYT